MKKGKKDSKFEPKKSLPIHKLTYSHNQSHKDPHGMKLVMPALGGEKSQLEQGEGLNIKHQFDIDGVNKVKGLKKAKRGDD